MRKRGLSRVESSRLVYYLWQVHMIFDINLFTSIYSWMNILTQTMYDQSKRTSHQWPSHTLHGSMSSSSLTLAWGITNGSMKGLHNKHKLSKDINKKYFLPCFFTPKFSRFFAINKSLLYLIRSRIFLDLHCINHKLPVIAQFRVNTYVYLGHYQISCIQGFISGFSPFGPQSFR